MATETTPARRRVTLRKRKTYGREDYPAGAVLTVDAELAAKWLREGTATEAGEATELWTTCPKCRASFWIEATPKDGQFWVQCKSPHCGHGWMR